ncbi:MAG: hypothetical protein DI623_01100 [Sphingomonas sanxanigenens]|uniref:Uncharacterized protein n=1 Tax=Sphingomonas sanxanigenens TaxID=397260 RepID=A0A2W5CCJ0_9SPHN|nr:MAG: hypothetical protein DI623_01100 [Sphingomonas sanxanigenens]
MILIPFLLAAAVPAAAPQPTIEQDVRCLLMMSLLAGDESNSEAKQGGTFGVLIWYGRLSARLSAEEIRAAVKRESASMTNAIFKTDGQRCSQEMAAYGGAMQAVAAEMDVSGAEKPAK